MHTVYALFNDDVSFYKASRVRGWGRAGIVTCMLFIPRLLVVFQFEEMGELKHALIPIK